MFRCCAVCVSMFAFLALTAPAQNSVPPSTPGSTSATASGYDEAAYRKLDQTLSFFRGRSAKEYAIDSAKGNDEASYAAAYAAAVAQATAENGGDPNTVDLSHAQIPYVKTLRECGYRWLLVPTFLGLAFSLYLANIEANVLGVWCIYCVISLGIISLMSLLTLGTVVSQFVRKPSPA